MMNLSIFDSTNEEIRFSALLCLRVKFQFVCDHRRTRILMNLDFFNRMKSVTLSGATKLQVLAPHTLKRIARLSEASLTSFAVK